MKYIYICIALNVYSMLLAGEIAVQARTASIYHRYYLIKRLKQSCMLLQQASVCQSIPFELLDATVFKSEDVRLATEAMKIEKNIEPLAALWDDFYSYQKIDDELFKHEFIELIYVIYDLMYPIARRSNRSVEHTLLAIDCVVDTKRYSDFSMRTQPKDLSDVTTDLVAKRFYIIKRLQKSMHLLERLHEQSFSLFDDVKDRSSNALIQEIECFHHDRVRESIMQMCQTKNLEPLLRLCDEAKQYRFAQDESFLQEMLMNIFLVYKTILLRQGSHDASPVIVNEMNHVLEIYEHLSSMPLDQTLEAIDQVTDRLMAIQAKELSHPRYTRWVFSGALCALTGIGAYYYFVHR